MLQRRALFNQRRVASTQPAARPPPLVRAARRQCSATHAAAAATAASPHAAPTAAAPLKAAAGVKLARPLLIDNYDSYSYNLFQILAEVYGVEPLVYHNDEVDLATLRRLAAAGAFDHVVISPGPGRPSRAGDIGVCLDALTGLPDVPVLGVCLGHQALAHAAGARVVEAPEPVHGRLSRLAHSGHPLFAGIPQDGGLDVVRYHSLIVDAATVPPQLEPIAWTTGDHHAVRLTNGSGGSGSGSASDGDEQQQQQQAQHQGLIMGLAHRERPHYGVQFHPESIATRYGVQVLCNYRDMAYAHQGRAVPPELRAVGGERAPGRAFPPRVDWPPVAGLTGSSAAAAGARGGVTGGRQGGSVVGSSWHDEDGAAADGLPPAGGVARARVCWRKLPGALGRVAGGSQALFEGLVGPGEDTFWLDSAATDRARFSNMGKRGGPLWCRVTYQLPDPSTLPPGAAGADAAAAADELVSGTLTITKADGAVVAEQASSTIWAYLQQQLAAVQLDASALVAAEQLPFDFWGGFVGYLGYELRAEAAGGRCGAPASTPDAGFFFADRTVVVDHHTGDVYLVALAAGSDAGDAGDAAAASDGGLEAAVRAAEAWIAGAAAGVAALEAGAAPAPAAEEAPAAAAAAAAAAPPAPFALRDGEEAYVANVAACQKALTAGESYELCLTTSLKQPAAACPWDFYRTLRKLNPAPYAAWLALGEGSGRWANGEGAAAEQQQQQKSAAAAGDSNGAWRGGPVTICCSSPERFLRGGRGGGLEAKPIKGTAPRALDDPALDAARAAALRGSEKERAENLMIVDLLRNDLGRVCEVGSVHVPGLIEVESYATVHQLVSTVRGQRRAGVSCVDAARAAFPGGSMTGAPKLRSMAILEGLERAPRGVYSGALGFFSVNDTFDLNIVIRTAVYANGEAAIGAGGAVTVQSDARAEYEEMRLKASALVRAMGAAQGLDAPTAERNVVA